MIRNLLKLVWPLAGCVFLASCGGTGSNGGTTFVTGSVAPPDPGPVNFNTPEYRRNYGLDQMKAIAAYDNGATGAGVTVAVIDSGIDIDHPQIQPNIHSSSTNIVTGKKEDLNDIDGHGTAVAGVIASIRDPFNNLLESRNQNTHGVAFDAQVMALNAASTGSCGSDDGCSFADRNIAAALDYARARGVKVVNISLGGDSFNSPVLVDAYKRAVAAGMVIVLAAGNKEDEDTDVQLARPENSASVAWADWANGQIIVAGAVDQSSTIADFSHRSGTVAQNVFLVAGGDSIPTLGVDGGYFFYSGTSFATPHISGAAALLVGAFPNLTGKQVADLLFDSATDLGAAGPDAIYGSGLVNIEEAFKPKGTTSIAVISATGETTLIDMDSSALLGGAAFGGFRGLAAAVNNSMMLDDYNRSYRVDLGQRVFDPNATIELESIMDSRKGSRRSTLQFDQATHVTFSWREDWRFRDVEEQYFSHQNKAKNRNYDLRMKLAMTLSPDQSMTFSQGLSLKEAMEDYDQDAFLSLGKEDFVALMGRSDSQYLALAHKVDPATHVTIATGHGGRQWRQYNLKADSYVMMARLDHGLSDTVHLGFDLGVINEKGSVLGSLSTGALSLGKGATTTFVNTRFDWALSGKMQVFGRASYGRTAVQAADVSLVQQIDDLSSASFSFGVIGHSLFQRGDRLSLAISQPLRVSGGTADMSYVSARDYQTDSLSFISSRTSLSPEGREIDFELAYRAARIFGAEVDINLLHQINPNHDAAQPDNTGILIRLGSEF